MLSILDFLCLMWLSLSYYSLLPIRYKKTLDINLIYIIILLSKITIRKIAIDSLRSLHKVDKHGKLITRIFLVTILFQEMQWCNSKYIKFISFKNKFRNHKFLTHITWDSWKSFPVICDKRKCLKSLICFTSNYDQKIVWYLIYLRLKPL